VPCVAWPPPASDQAVSAGRDQIGVLLDFTAKSWSIDASIFRSTAFDLLYCRHLSSC